MKRKRKKKLEKDFKLYVYLKNPSFILHSYLTLKYSKAEIWQIMKKWNHNIFMSIHNFTNTLYRAKKRHEEFKIKMDMVDAAFKEKLNDNKSSVLSTKDLKLLAINETPLTRQDILKMHVKNYGELGLKQRRQVYEKIQNTKAMQARKIFLKELNVLGWQFRNKTQNPDPQRASLEEIS